ncbi:FAD-binding domain-containing protein [Rhodoferax lacus]|uniref:FAD-binding domain-containing protein n=1 Tax=Rhodoferax lacus TaxID=2184758 RepID=UPI001F407E35|nr:FAD-binding domain-containing protein [Rhodoferax lacus]
MFEPTRQAALTRLAAVQPDAYARTRNALDGAVTGLSPYLTHGLLSLREVYAAVHARQPLDAKHKFVFELGWRAYYRHVWAHLGPGLHQSLHPGLLPDAAYVAQMPADVLEARSGVAAIDLAVRTLYTTGYLHNHARMWLASYLVHLRRVHWHTAAQWMLGHLLDGDVASNHLSWQWVAGTGSTKPYLFNADNVAKYAPAPWHSPGTVIDTSYEALDLLARSASAPGHGVDGRAADGCAQGRADDHPMGAGLSPPALLATPPDALWSPPDASAVAGRDVWLQHPWSLGAVPQGLGDDALVVGVGLAECHAQTPWSTRRWDFVGAGLQAQTSALWWATAPQLAEALRGARAVGWQAEPHADAALASVQALLAAGKGAAVITAHAVPCLFEPVPKHCQSFAQWWRQTRIAL